MMGFGIIGTIIILVILNYIIKDAVEEGVFNALKRYDALREKNTSHEE